MSTKRLARPLFVAVFLTLSVLIVSFALQARRSQFLLFEEEARITLHSINENKAAQIVRWQQERLADAAVLQHDMAFFTPLARLTSGTATPADRARVLEWLSSLMRNKHYVNAIIVSDDGRALLGAGEHLPRSDHYRDLVASARATGLPLMTNLHNDGGIPRLHAGLTIPIPTASPAALLLAVDPVRELYPIISWWPRNRKTAETVLITREGDEVIYLSPSRHWDVELAGRHVPLSDHVRSVVRAAESGTGRVDGLDYRGRAVMATCRKLPISNWILETKVDREELSLALAPQDRQLAILVVLLILVSAGALGALWRYVGHRIEEPFRRTRAMLETTIRSSPAALVALNEAGLVTLWNPAAQRLFGWTEREVLGRPLPEQLAALPASTADRTLAITRQDSAPIWVSCSSTSLHDSHESSLTVCIDVTDRQRAETSLRQSERDFRELVESAPIGILIETGSVVRYLNRSALELSGTTNPADITGTCVLDRVHPDHRDLLRQRMDRLHLDRLPTPPAEIRYLRRDGSVVWVNARSIPTIYQGEPGSIAFFIDLTAEKAAQREKADLEERYRQAQKLESIGRLAGSIAHDFNNHLTVINGYSRLLKEDQAICRESLLMITQILEAGERASQLTRQLLAFSRKQLIEFRTLDVNDIIRASEKMFRTLIGEDIHFETELAPDLSAILADPGQLNQVLMNLLVNARDAMPEGGRLLLTTANVQVDPAFTAAHPGMSPGPHVLLSVTDTGCGMDEETRTHAFEPFYTTKQEKGTGLGLATVFGIVRQLNGAIDLDSTPGAGTAFHLYFPATTQCLQAPTESAPATTPRRGSELVLLAEDSEQLRRFATSVLTSAGYRVLEAANGAEALQAYRRRRRQERIHLLVTDIIMPEMNGRQLADALWQIDEHLPVLFISGYTASTLATFDLSDPRATYLPKPFTPAEFLQRASDSLDARRRSRSRLLLVDDDAGVRRFLRTILEANGYEVSEAADGEQATRELEQHDVDVVITDLVMPAQEGIETIARIRRQWPAVKIIAISGAFSGQLLHAAKLLGAQHALVKPVQPEALLAALQQMLAEEGDADCRAGSQALS